MLTCVKGNGGDHAAVAIKRLRVRESYEFGSDEYYVEFNKVWRERHKLGCVSCGKFCKFGNGGGYCRRCWLIRARVRNAEYETFAAIPTMIARHARQMQRLANDERRWLVAQRKEAAATKRKEQSRKRELKALARRLENDLRLTPQQRIALLLENAD